MRRTIGLGLCVFGCQMPNPLFGGADDAIASDADTLAPGDGDADAESGSEASSSNSETSSGTDTGTTAETDTDTETTAETDTDTTDTEQTCEDGLLLCDGACIDPGSDPLNCGDCNVTCEDGQVCAGGQCAQIKRVFITSVPLAANLQGIEAANFHCNLLAGSGQLQGTFKAWLSTPNSWPAQAFSKAGAYVRTDNVLVAKHWEDLVDGSLHAPIDVTEFGLPVLGSGGCDLEAVVWSSTTPSGVSAGPPNCNGWTAADISATGQVGNAHAVDGSWSLVDGCQVSCAAPLPIYCIEQ